MAITNQLKTKLSKPKFSAVISTEGYQKLINNTLKDPQRAANFVANIITAVSTNPDLEDCEPRTILSAGLLGETLKLSPSPILGHFYIIPYYNKNGKEAVFQLGYKGYIQLAIRSGYYKKLNVTSIKEGELIKYNPLEEEIEVKLIEDEELREKTPTIGYYAFFEYTNGFKKAIYWSKNKMVSHATTYSPGYKKDIEKNTSYTFWSKNFDDMAYKTMLRQLISKWGIMSIEMQQAFIRDQAVIKENGEYEYIDIEDNSKENKQEEVKEEIKEEIKPVSYPQKEDAEVTVNSTEVTINSKPKQKFADFDLPQD